MRLVKPISSAIAAIALGVFASSASASSVLFSPIVGTGHFNVLPNGGFESGMNNWSSFSGNVQFSASSAITIDGAHVLQSACVSSFSGSGFATVQTVPVVGGQNYVLSAYVNAAQATTGDNNYLDLNDVPFDPTVLAVNGDPRLEFIYQTVSVPANFSSLTVRVVRDNVVTAGHSVYFDDIALTPASSFVAPTVPEPASLGIVGIATMAGLLRRQRSRRSEQHAM